MKNLIVLIALLVFGCTSPKPESSTLDESVITKPDDFNELSIYQIPSQWATQNNDTIRFKDLQGDVLAVVMIYTSCQVACPRLVADMRNIHEQVRKKKNEGVRYVLVSIDPEVDTPEKMKQFSIENEMIGNEWVFLQGNEGTVREFANILAVRYKQISPIDFSHSNIISVFDKEGVLRHQQEGLGVDYQETIEKIIDLSR